MSAIPYIISRTFTSLRGNLLSHVMTILTIAFVTSLFGFSALVYANLDQMAANFSREIRIIAYLNPAVTPQDVANLQARVSKLGGIANVRFVNSREGYKRLAEQFRGEESILAGLGEDFLPPTLEIEPAVTVRDAGRIGQLAAKLTSLPGITDVRYGKEWVDGLGRAAELARLMTFVIGGLLLFTIIFVVSNTIKLTVYLRRDELETMRLVGATKSFIRGPFVIESVFLGAVGSGLAILAVFGLFEFVTAQANLPGFIRFFRPVFLPWTVTAGIILGSMVLCVIGSIFSSRHFLRI